MKGVSWTSPSRSTPSGSPAHSRSLAVSSCRVKSLIRFPLLTVVSPLKDPDGSVPTAPPEGLEPEWDGADGAERCATGLLAGFDAARRWSGDPMSGHSKEDHVTTTGDLPATAEVSPGPLIRLSIADCGAKVLQGAVRVGVFTALASGPATESEIRERTGLHPRFAADFLDALVGLGLLEREDGAYRNSALSTAYLVEETESYLGGFIELTNET